MQIVYKKACNRLNILRMLNIPFVVEALMKINTSFIRPILEYRDVIWDNCNERIASFSEDVQITAERINTGIKVYSTRTIG